FMLDSKSPGGRISLVKSFIPCFAKGLFQGVDPSTLNIRPADPRFLSELQTETEKDDRKMKLAAFKKLELEQDKEKELLDAPAARTRSKSKIPAGTCEYKTFAYIGLEKSKLSKT